MLQIQLIKQPYEVNFSGNELPYSFCFTPYGFIERRQNLRMNIAIEKEVSNGSGVFTTVDNQVLFPDNNGVIAIDIKTIVDAYLQYYTPRFFQQQAVKIIGQSANFRVVATIDKDGQPLGDPIVSNTITVLKGGLSYEQYHYKGFFDNIVANKLPLSSTENVMAPYERKYLTWLYTNAVIKQQRLAVRFFYSDNTTNYFEIGMDVLSEKWGIYMADVSIGALLFLAANPAVNNVFAKIQSYDLVKYRVFVIDEDDNEVLNPVEYVIDYRNFFGGFSSNDIYTNNQYTNHYCRALAYTNSFGAFETLNVLGEIEMQAEYTSSDATVVPPPSGIRNAVLQAQQVAVTIEETEKFIGATNFLSKTKVDALRDLLLSRNVYELKLQRFIPVMINKKTVKFYSNKDSLYSMAIEWQHAFSNKFYVPENMVQVDLACPALEKFTVVQIAKNKLQIVWAMPYPYDILKITIDNGIEVFESTLNGNAGSQVIGFDNPAIDPATATIIITGAVLCNPDSVPISMGPTSTVTIEAYANLVPVANDDQFYIAAGYNTPQQLPGSVLDNDYDVDGEAIEAVTTGGATAQGGSYEINKPGEVTYQPPSSLFNGIDSFTYQVYEVNNTAVLSNTATVYINVGNVGLGNGFYAKIQVLNHVENYSGGNLLVTESIFVYFYADPLCTIPKDATGLGVTINVRNRGYRRLNYNSIILDETITQTYLAVGTNVNIFNGLTYHRFRVAGVGVNIYEDFRVFSLEPGAGYIPV